MSNDDDKMDELERLSREQDERVRDLDRVQLLDRLQVRMPDLDLDSQRIEWTTLDDGSEGLLVNGGGIDGGDCVTFANAGEDVHAIGSLMPLAPAIGCIVIKPDGSRVLPAAGIVADPLAGADDDE